MKKLRYILLGLVLMLLVAGGIGFWGYRDLQTPVAHGRDSEYIVIPRGSAPTQIVNQLASQGVIGRGWPLLVYMRLTGAGSRLRAGEYRFPSPITPLEVLRRLQEGQQRLNRFTVIEGWTRWDIAEAMARVPEFQLNDRDAALTLMNNVSSIGDLDPQAENLEGYLYPATYSFPPETTPQNLIEMMVRRFRQTWTEEMTARARQMNRTPREIVTIASLIETEARLAEERPLVASVIYNRLRINMSLGIDSSVIYASKLAGRWRNDGRIYQSDLDRVSPYNTRLVRGLPPGPIASPGASSIEAALNPAETNYLYYVRNPARDDGAHNFYESEADFSRGVQALREWERQRDARNGNFPSPSPSASSSP
jgi:UPF0755 protein